METLRQLILQELDEDGRSHKSDDTPTNEMTNGGSLLTERQRPQSLETVLDLTIDEEAGPTEAPPTDSRQPSVHVVRKGKGTVQRNFSFPELIFPPHEADVDLLKVSLIYLIQIKSECL